jgi:hypothetical protein
MRASLDKTRKCVIHRFGHVAAAPRVVVSIKDARLMPPDASDFDLIESFWVEFGGSTVCDISMKFNAALLKSAGKCPIERFVSSDGVVHLRIPLWYITPIPLVVAVWHEAVIGIKLRSPFIEELDFVLEVDMYRIIDESALKAMADFTRRDQEVVVYELGPVIQVNSNARVEMGKVSRLCAFYMHAAPSSGGHFASEHPVSQITLGEDAADVLSYDAIQLDERNLIEAGLAPKAGKTDRDVWLCVPCVLGPSETWKSFTKLRVEGSTSEPCIVEFYMVKSKVITTAGGMVSMV